jgi:hypothetical protein
LVKQPDALLVGENHDGRQSWPERQERRLSKNEPEPDTRSDGTRQLLVRLTQGAHVESPAWIKEAPKLREERRQGGSRAAEFNALPGMRKIQLRPESVIETKQLGCTHKIGILGWWRIDGQAFHIHVFRFW